MYARILDVSSSHSQVQATAASSGESSAARNLSTQDYSGKWSTQKGRAAASSQPSFSGAALIISESRLSLRTVTAAPSSGMSRRGHSPPVAPSRCRSRSRSPVYGSHSSSPRDRSRSVWSMSVSSLRGESYEGMSRQSRHSRSPSRTSSREGSASPGRGKRGSCSHSPSQSRRVDEDCRQEEKSSPDFVTVVSHLRSLTGLPEDPSEGRKIHGFMAVLEDDDQPAASYKLPIGGTSADILADIDNRVSSTSSGMCSREVSKLLPFQGVRSHKFYRFLGEDITKVKALNLHMTELAGLHTVYNLNKTGVLWSSASARCQLLVAKTASTLWANLILKRRDTVLAKVKDSMSFESFVDLRNSEISTGEELFPSEVLDKAIKESSTMRQLGRQ